MKTVTVRILSFRRENLPPPPGFVVDAAASFAVVRTTTYETDGFRSGNGVSEITPTENDMISNDKRLSELNYD